MKVRIEILGRAVSAVLFYGIGISIAAIIRPEFLDSFQIRENLFFYLFVPYSSALVVVEVSLRTKIIQAIESRDRKEKEANLHYTGSGRFVSETSDLEYRFGPLGIQKKS